MEGIMKTILVPIDFSDVTRKIIEQTIQIALALNAKVHLIHVTASSSRTIKLQSEMTLPTLDGMEERYFNPARYDIIRDQIASQLKKEHSQMLELRKQLTEKNIETLALLIEGDTREVIVKEAEEINADMIILGSHGHGSFHKALVGSVTNSVLKKQSCPVLIVSAK
jgi:nucleotide-binding universal stress UspA family protein